MITGFTILNVEGRIDSADALMKQRFPRINVNFDELSATGDKAKIKYSYVADYHDGDAKDAKLVGHIKLTGVVEITETKSEITNIEKKWGDSRTLPIPLAKEIINGLNFRCGATGTLVSYSLGLIPPLIVSNVDIQEEKK